MSLAELGNSPGQVESIIINSQYVADPLLAYEVLGKANSLLLESAEIDSKDDLKTLLLIDAALRIECNGNVVQVEALSENGKAVLSVLKTYLHAQLVQDNEDTTAAKSTCTFKFVLSGDSMQDEDARLKDDSVFDVLRVIKNQLKPLRDHDQAVFLGGVFSYDLIETFEDLPNVPNGDNDCPEYVFYLAETLLLLDHRKQTSEIIGSVFSGEDVAQQYFAIHQRLETINKTLHNLPAKIQSAKTLEEHPLTCNKSDQEYCDDVLTLKENILDGDIFQVVPSRAFSLACPSPLNAYQALKQSNPSPYMFYLQDRDFVMFGASPESALKYDQTSNQVEVYPIAGTRPRGKRANGEIDYDLDSRLELNLREDEKEKSEHIMLVDLARNDVARVSQAGTRHVKELLKVDRYSHVMHLVSRVVGQLRDDLDALHAYQACMNMGTLVGAPKISAACLVRNTEKQKRGSYGGAVGYLNAKGDMDTCIVIRSAFVKNDIAFVQAGAGVVNDSIPQAEADETRAKAQAVISAIKVAHQAMSSSDSASKHTLDGIN